MSKQTVEIAGPVRAVVNALYPNEKLDAIPARGASDLRVQTARAAIDAYLGATIRVGFRYQDGEVLTPECEATSRDEEFPTVVLDLGDGEWLTLGDLRVISSGSRGDS